MSKQRPWLETWEQDDDAGMRVMVADTDEQVARVFDGGERAAFSRRNTMSLADQEHGLGRATLIAAAPALARALCRVEWSSGHCEGCGQGSRYWHLADCPLDAALTAAGLSEKDREEVRRGQEA